MKQRERALLERAVVALELIADALAPVVVDTEDEEPINTEHQNDKDDAYARAV